MSFDVGRAAGRPGAPDARDMWGLYLLFYLLGRPSRRPGAPDVGDMWGLYLFFSSIGAAL